MEAAGEQLLRTLSLFQHLNIQEFLEQLENDIGKYTKFLPTSINRETNTSADIEINIDESVYGKIIRTFLSTLDDNLAILRENLKSPMENLMIVRGCNFLVLQELLASITEYLGHSTKDDSVEFMISVLEKILTSDAILSSLISTCKIRCSSVLETEEYERARKDCIQIIVSLPSRVSNRLKGRISECFVPINFSRIISFQIVRTILFLNDEVNGATDIYDVNALSLLISKLLTNFGSENFVELVEILIHLSLEDKKSCQTIQGILMNIPRASVPAMATLLLENIGDPADVERIFRSLMMSNNWRFVVTKKFLFFSYFKNDKIIVNLTNCLLCSDSDNYHLPDLIVKLLDIWGDKSALNHTNLDQQEFITKVVLLSMKKIKGTLKSVDKHSILELVFSGTSAHLESMQVEIRAMGMITGELLVNCLNECDTPKLQFDYDKMPREGVTVVQRLRGFWREECDNSENKSPSHGNSVKSEELISRLGVKSTILGVIEEANGVIGPVKMESETADDPDFDEKNTKHEIQPMENAEDDTLDSDDDLIPYDMSNDRKNCENLRPLYIRELKENLINFSANSDPRIFSEALQCSERLITSQLPNDDASFGLELLNIFSKLTEITYVEHFSLLKFRACVAITKIHPQVSADYFCREFHARVGSHSVNDRLFFLNVLAEAARELSRIGLDTKNDEEIPEITEKIQGQLASKRVSLFVNTETGKKIETLYDDDDIEISENFDADKWKKKAENQRVVAQRINENTRVFAHPSKQFSAKVNRFNDVAVYFFYPLFYGMRTRDEQIFFNPPKHFEDHGNLLLINFIKTISTIMVAAENCVIAPKMGEDILEFAWNMRFHEEAVVRCCIIEAIAAVVVSVSKANLTGVMFDLLLELRIWLMDVSQELTRGEPYAQCREMAVNVVNLINSVFS